MITRLVRYSILLGLILLNLTTQLYAFEYNDLINSPLAVNKDSEKFSVDDFLQQFENRLNLSPFRHARDFKNEETVVEEVENRKKSSKKNQKDNNKFNLVNAFLKKEECFSTYKEYAYNYSTNLSRYSYLLFQVFRI